MEHVIRIPRKCHNIFLKVVMLIGLKVPSGSGGWVGRNFFPQGKQSWRYKGGMRCGRDADKDANKEEHASKIFFSVDDHLHFASTFFTFALRPIISLANHLWVYVCLRHRLTLSPPPPPKKVVLTLTSFFFNSLSTIKKLHEKFFFRGLKRGGWKECGRTLLHSTVKTNLNNFRRGVRAKNVRE